MKKQVCHQFLTAGALMFSFILSGQGNTSSSLGKSIDTGKIANIVYPALTEREGKGLNIPVPPNEHPRLFFMKKDIPALKEKMANPLMKECWDKITQSAGISTDGKLKQDGSGQNLDSKVTNAIEAKAFMYAFSGDGAAGKEAINALFNFNNTLIINYSKGDVCREIGRCILTNAIVYDWCYDLLEDQERKALIGRMEFLATKLEIEWPKLKQGSVVGHGVEAQIARDMLSCGIAVYNEKPEIYNLAAGRIFAEFIPARKFFYPAGYHHQGSSYGQYRFQWDLYITLLFDKMGYPYILGKDQGKVPYIWIYTRRPDGQLLRDGDDYLESSNSFGKYWTIPCIAMSGSYFNDPVQMGEAIKEKLIGRDYLFDFLLINPAVPVITDKSGLPLTRYFKEPLGEMVARTGWGDELSSNAVVAEMKIGVYNFANHAHLDAGNFQIYYKGPLAVESGIYEGRSGGYGSAHHINYCQRTIAHNSMLIYNPIEKFLWWSDEVSNDGGQQFPNNGIEPVNLDILLSKDYKTGEVLAHGFGPDTIKPEYSYIKGELAEAYSDKVKSFIRSFVFLNLNNSEIPAVLFVFDRVTASSKDFKKIWLMHCVEEPVIKGNITCIKRNEKGYNGRLINSTLLPVADNLTISKVGGKGNEYSVFNKNYSQTTRRESNSADSAVWRIEVSPKNCSATDNFLNVMQVMDYEGGPKQPLPTETIETDKLVGAKIGDRIVLFSKDGSIIDKPFKINIKGDKIVKVLITDISIGRWKVENTDTREKSPLLIRNDNQLLYFNTGKGSYTITNE